MLRGAIGKLEFSFARPVEYSLRIGDETLALNALIGEGLSITWLGPGACRHCGAALAGRYGGGYCYPCFRRLAVCDLCVMAPSRCHYHLGTCREPDWGEANCMRSHVVYLADSGGLKVGLTRHASGVPRWVEQGAFAGLVIAAAPTRRAAGDLEAALAARVADKSDWRRQVTGRRAGVCLAEEADRLVRAVGECPGGARWQIGREVAIDYPVRRFLRRAVRLALPADSPVVGRLVGIVGSFLLFDYGALNLGEYNGCDVVVERVANVSERQGELF